MFKTMIVYVFFYFIYNSIAFTKKNKLSYESCIPIYLPKNEKRINQIYSNIKNFIQEQEKNNNNGTIHLIFTNKRMTKMDSIKKKSIFYTNTQI